MREKKEIIVTDGIVHKEIFNKQKVRLLWILKEVNDTTSEKGWDICQFLRIRDKDKEGLFHYSYWRATFGLVCKLSYAILEPDKSYEEVNNYEDVELANILDKVAYINIKKTSGGSVVNLINFSKYIEDGSYLIKLESQIKEINPSIIYCGGTFEYVFSNLRGFNLSNEWVYKKDKIIYINGWHPNARIIHRKYFNEIQLRLKAVI